MTDKLIATLNKAGVRAISTDLWGIFFEDISYSGDGGLNADLVQNGAFRIQPLRFRRLEQLQLLVQKSCPPAPSQPSTCSPTIR